MIIDVVTIEGVGWMRYETSEAPRVGETISTLRPTENTFEVVSIDHLVGPFAGTDDMKQKLITVTVKEINANKI